jgi:hypothetical protein
MWDRAIETYQNIIETAPETRTANAGRYVPSAVATSNLKTTTKPLRSYEKALGLVAPGNWLFEDLKNRLVAVYQDLGDLQGLADYLLGAH